MTERERQTEFLKCLLRNDSGECRRLKGLVQQCQRNEKSIRRALFLMIMVGSFSVVGLGYCAVLLPEFFDNATPVLVKIFCALGLGSLFCMAIFGGCLIWYRNASNAVNQTCRTLILEQLNVPQPTLESQDPIPVNKSISDMYQIGTTENSADSRIIQFPRAS